MKKIYTFIILGSIMLFASSAMAQTPKITKLPLQQIQKAGELNLGEVKEDWAPMLRNTSVIHAPVAEGAYDLQAVKNRLTEKLMRDRGNQQTTQSRSVVPDPVRLSGFRGNAQDGIPNDDDIAASATHIVHTSNSVISVFDANGAVLKALSLESLGAPADTLLDAFDPRVMYDAGHDRWVLVYDTGSDPGHNDLIIAFSQTNDPTGVWNRYNLNGNLRPNGVDVWCDYPQVALGTDEFFITGNLFGATGSSNSSTGVWQIPLAAGYAGTAITVQTYLLGGISLTPVEGVGPNYYGPNMYFVNNIRGTVSRSISLYEIDNTIAAGGSLSLVKSLTGTVNYSPSPNAPQKDAPGNAQNGGALNTGDGRIQSAYLLGDKINLVAGSNVGGRPGIFHATITLSPLGAGFHSMKSRTISDPELYIGFPTVAYGGITCARTGAQSQFLFFNYTSDTKFPGNAIIYMDECGELSDPLVLRVGEGYLRPTGDANDSRNRWGDYADITSTGNPGEVWVVGYSPNRRHEHVSWISQVNSPFGYACPSCPSTGIEIRMPEGVEEVKAYPIPAVERIFFDFTVSKDAVYHAYIVDLTGKKIRTVLKDRLRPGTAKVGFNTLMIAAGTYNIVIEGVDGKIFSKKFTVQN